MRTSSTRSTCQAPGTSGSGVAVDLASDEPDDGRAGLVLGPHQRPRTVRRRDRATRSRRSSPDTSARARPPADVESGSASTSGATLVGEASQHGVRERHRPLEPGSPHELDGLVDGRVARHAVEEGELVRAEAERGPNGRVEPRDGPASDRLDRVVERPGPLHGAVGELPGERAVAVVEAGGRGAQSAVGVRLVLEDAQEHVEGRRARGRDGRHRRRPRSHAACVHPPAAVGLHLDRLERAVLPDAVPARR